MENNSKQAMLSIVGIAVLVIAVVGVSFAFFTYSKQGTTNNVITTGSISFSYSEATNGITLENQFPETTEEGKQNEKFTFKVSGTLPTTSEDVSYTVTAVAGDGVSGKTRMPDSQIDLIVTSTTGTIAGSYASGATAGNSASGFQIASGTIAADGTLHEDNYSMTMWVNKTVTISDTTTTATYCASESQCAGGRDVYSNMYYSLKVNVEAQG